MSVKEPTRPTSFPDAYKAFLPVLERLTEPMLHVLQGHLLRLDNLLNSVQSQSRNLQGDFEGIGGLTQRGDINRIVKSELLLRSEVPNEFLRRIAEGEALYMETEHSDPNEHVVYRVMISVGPYMLGHGRLLALASLLFLARAALSRNAELHWTFLPTENSIHWFRGLSVNSVKRFLKFASARDLTTEDTEAALERWERFNEHEDSSVSDVESWLIGASGAVNQFFETLTQGEVLKNALILTLDPPPLDGPRTAVLDLRRNGRNIRRVRLDFPEDTICLSALNRPFNPEKISDQNRQDLGQNIARIRGWEPRYILSQDARHHIVKFDKTQNGLLFLRLAKGQNTHIQASFFSMSEDTKLVGTHFAPNLNAQIMIQTNVQDENITYFDYDLNRRNLTLKKQKPITSKHLFAKQREGVIPPMVTHYSKLKCYTTLGQAFEFTDFREGKPSINILYKENHVVYASAKYSVVLFDPVKKTHQEIQAISSRLSVSHDTPSLLILKDHTKVIDAFPVEDTQVAKRLLDVAYTPSSHTLAYSVQPGEWNIMGRNSANIDISLHRYERVIRSHLSNDRLKIIILSDASLGGENILKSVAFINGNMVEQAKLFDFDKIRHALGEKPIIEVQEMINGGFRAVTLGETGDPSQLVLLQKRGGQFKANIIDLTEALEKSVWLEGEM